MKIELKVRYQTKYGERIVARVKTLRSDGKETDETIDMAYRGNGDWLAELTVPGNATGLAYHYEFVNQNGEASPEWGGERALDLVGVSAEKRVYARDHWRAPSSVERIMHSSCFKEVLLRPNARAKASNSKARRVLRFSIQVPRIGERYQVCVLGNQSKLGDWDRDRPLLLACGESFPSWSGSISVAELSPPVLYKYGIYDTEARTVVTIEDGEDRRLEPLPEGVPDYLFARSDESFRYPIGNWKGAGVAVPVFSLRTEKSAGIGDFRDLIDFIAWAKSVGMKMVQLLPLNETVASHDWLDSYPYKSISVMALHPVYLSLDGLGKLEDQNAAREIAERVQALNAKPHVDYPEVHRVKSRFYKLMYDQDRDALFASESFKAFFAENEAWLKPYAVFAYSRDRNGTSDFSRWKEHAVYDPAKVDALCDLNEGLNDDVAVHFYIQYHLDKQLREAADFARENGIVLKGDIPIGISPQSVEAWTDARLFNLDAQAGAPPDDFAVKGQNWGFPTYDWAAMAKEGFSWWTTRLSHMGKYFDAYRIDHILGFFRIWEIPMDAVEGVLGYFNPALPMSADEIRGFGIDFNVERMARPHIPRELVDRLFGPSAEDVIERYLDENNAGEFVMKPTFDSQRKVNRYFLDGIEEEELSDSDRRIRDGLFDLIANVLFVRTGEDEWHPRISLRSTFSFACLDDATKQRLIELYIQFFYRRHDEFWHRNAMEKLPAIISASDMLVCGEDLGMVPDCVPPVMRHLDILSLEIQRMPKDPSVSYAHPADAPYLSVCTTSTHDMSTVRGWWEADREDTQRFFNEQLGCEGEAPYFAEPWVCERVIEQHLHSPAMWVTLPIQDFLAIDGDLRWDETRAEQINEPSNVRHHWRFRMCQSIETLRSATAFNARLLQLVRDAGRDSAY